MNLAPEWRRLCDENETMRAEIERLTQERDQFIEQIALRQPSAVERDMQEIMRINNELKAEIERLNAVLDDAMTNGFDMNPLVQELRAEIERLQADKDVQRSQERNASYEKSIDDLHEQIAEAAAFLDRMATNIESHGLKWMETGAADCRKMARKLRAIGGDA
jgi:chromosome segregation ATPase